MKQQWQRTVVHCWGKGGKEEGRWCLCTEARGHCSFILARNVKGELHGVSSAWGRGAGKGYRARCHWNDNPILSPPKGCLFPLQKADLLILLCSLSVSNTKQSREQGRWGQCKNGRSRLESAIFPSHRVLSQGLRI